ncbi:MAG: hypothetical protein IPM51_05375 [Sphingobacteriaceae bacterium]|nr:hypothetical protein [Sphingobacteriaceae bacterium]
MKKVFILTIVAAATFASCKKERTCHCRIVQDNYDLTGAKISTNVSDVDIKMEKTGYQKAFKNCIHKKTTMNYPNTSTKMADYDEYCELKK